MVAKSIKHNLWERSENFSYVAAEWLKQILGEGE
jgi:hypothetical protein